jgi:hypothetical protein
MPMGDNPYPASVDTVTLNVVHNGTDADLKRAVEGFIDTNPDQVNEIYLMVFCTIMEIKKSDGQLFECMPFSFIEESIDTKWKEN